MTLYSYLLYPFILISQLIFLSEHAKENQSRLANQFEEERNKLLETIGQLEKKLQQQQDSRLQEDPQLASDQQAGLISTLSSAFGKKASGGNQPQKQQQKNDGSLDVSQQQVSRHCNLQLFTGECENDK